MFESGDWIQPQFNHVRYYEKPPLLYWSVATSYRFLGVNDFAARLPSALAYVGTSGVTFLLGLELLGPEAAPMAALIYATSVGPYIFGRFVFTDTLFVFCLTSSLYGLALVIGRRSRWAGPLLFSTGMSLAAMTKGFVGIVFPVATAGTFWLLLSDRRLLRDLRPVLSSLIVLAVVVPWHVLLEVRDPSFLRFYVLNEHILRFLNARVPIDYTPLSVPAFWLSTCLWLLPWSLFLPGLIADRKARRGLALPLVWSAWVLGFFTLNASRLEYYALPAFPALAVVLGGYWKRITASGRGDAGAAIPGLTLLGLALILLPPLFLFPDHSSAFLTSLVANLDGYYREYFFEHPGAAFPLVAGALTLAKPFTVVLIFVGGAVLLALRAARARLCFAIWIVGLVPLLMIVDRGMRLVGHDRSQREFARIVSANWSPGVELIVAGDYEDYCGISYYTGLPTKMFNAAGGDLLFGYSKGDAADFFIDRNTLDRKWNSETRVFLLGDKSLKIPGAIALAEGPRDVLLSNRPLTPPLPG